MASPQLEDGFARIANELLDALARIRLAGQENQIVFAVIRKTYGFNKKSDQISHGQLTAITGIKRVKVVELVKSLVSKRVLDSTNNGTRKPATIRINKNYEQWEHSPKKGTIPNKGTIASPNKGLSSSPHNGTHKRQPTKDNLQKTKTSSSQISKKPKFDDCSIELSFACLLRDLINERSPNGKLLVPAKTDLQTWARHIDLLMRIDGRSESDIESVIRWCQSDAFWKSNIMSTKKLREKFGTLFDRMQNAPPKYKTQRQEYEEALEQIRSEGD